MVMTAARTRRYALAALLMWLPACTSTPPPKEADIDFEKQVKAVRDPARVTFQGTDTAWVISRAEYDEGNPEKYIITQLMVLTRNPDGWHIRTISWSTKQP